ncbi:MAG TPA: hypothetical protein VHT91_14635 [Kofleriaceae bacterium]|nr:hypothetical protein [Kofleriaceae bacterium]
MPYHAGVLRLGLVVIALTLAAARPARAQYPPITSRAYAIDLYDGVAIGNTDMVGMGGAGAAVVLGTAGVLMNPSAIAVRPTTDHDRWSLDYHFSYLTGQYSSDYDNNGQVASGGAQLITAGLGGRIGNWAAAFTTLLQQTPVTGSSLTTNALRLRVVVSTWIPQIDLAVGGGFQIARFQLDPSSGPALFSISGSGLVAGATWLPHGESYRLGGAIDDAIDGGEVQPGQCDDPENCMTYILPARVRSPARLVAGAAYRWAPTAWNQQVTTPFRDEPSLTLAADLVVTGATASGAGVEAFGMHELQPSGRHTVVSVRGGAAYECLPGRLRLRAGSYWEPGRFDSVSGRAHATFGIDLRVLAFQLFGERRGRISLIGDVADRYRNVAVDIGFWH